MINYHPTNAVLERYVNGELPASVSVIVASHIEMCEKCRQQAAMLTEKAANKLFKAEQPCTEDVELALMFTDLMASESKGFVSVDGDDLAMLEAITSVEPELPADLPVTVTEIEVGGKRIALPRAIKSIALSEWKGLGKIARARLALEDNALKTSLLNIGKGGAIPAHTHKGFEITLLLQGSFSDEMGEYHVGDFIWLDGEHNHSPVTKDGCVCLTVSSDALQFTQGVSQLINPLGRFIY